MLLELAYIFFFSFASLFLLRKVAKSVGLVDVPTLRKQHEGSIPLIGGIAVFVTISNFIFNNPEIIPHSELFIGSIAILIIIGAIDDKFDLSFKIRLFVQAALTVVMMYFTGLELNYAGNVFGIGPVEFGILAPVFTVLAVLGAINAFNMVDGIDGLLGGLSIVTFTSISLIFFLNGQFDIYFLCIAVVVAILPYVLMNLGLLGRRKRIFMGDAGSMMIGFMVIWLLLSASQTPVEPAMRPVTALWLIALPLMDMTAIMYRRIKRGHSPFKPDRDHLHHICQRAGLSNIQTLVVICGLASMFAAIGVVGELLMIAEAYMFIAFLITFTGYSYLLLKNWPQHFTEKLDGRFLNLNPVDDDFIDDDLNTDP